MYSTSSSGNRLKNTDVIAKNIAVRAETYCYNGLTGRGGDSVIVSQLVEMFPSV